MGETAELRALKNEFNWVLDNEVPGALKELGKVISEGMSRFPLTTSEREKIPLPEKFVLGLPSTAPSDQVKVVVTLAGYSITQADINLKLPRPSGNKDFYYNTSIKPDDPWNLQQVQDSVNHLRMAHVELESAITALNCKTKLGTSKEVSAFLSRLMNCLHQSRLALVNPKKKTLDELRNSRHAKGLQPPLPPELAVSFFLQGWKLVFAVYHIVTDPKTNTIKFNRYQSEAVIPWVNEIILYVTIALQTAQRLKDKLVILEQYPDFMPSH